jgi:hypothetical protein
MVNFEKRLQAPLGTLASSQQQNSSLHQHLYGACHLPRDTHNDSKPFQPRDLPREPNSLMVSSISGMEISNGLFNRRLLRKSLDNNFPHWG